MTIKFLKLYLSIRYRTILRILSLEFSNLGIARTILYFALLFGFLNYLRYVNLNEENTLIIFKIVFLSYIYLFYKYKIDTKQNILFTTNIKWLVLLENLFFLLPIIILFALNPSINNFALIILALLLILYALYYKQTNLNSKFNFRVLFCNKDYLHSFRIPYLIIFIPVAIYLFIKAVNFDNLNIVKLILFFILSIISIIKPDCLMGIISFENFREKFIFTKIMIGLAYYIICSFGFFLFALYFFPNSKMELINFYISTLLINISIISINFILRKAEFIKTCFYFILFGLFFILTSFHYGIFINLFISIALVLIAFYNIKYNILYDNSK